MNTVSAAAPTATATPKGNAVSRQTIAQNFDTFLQLLTTQLRNQSPLDPLDTNQFTAQLVQFAEVEQTMRSNDTLEALLALQKAGQTSTAVSYLGSTIVAEGSQAPLIDGKAEWTLTSPKAAKATMTVRNQRGEIVHAVERDVAAGSQSFTWDGRGRDGAMMPAGTYSISIEARDPAGANVTVSTETQGVVDGVDLSANPPLLQVGERWIAIDKVRKLLRTGAT
jgi:flagellar basal-body rod modification protein FlgD